MRSWSVPPSTRGGIAAFLGYRILPDHVRVRRTSVARSEGRLARLAAEVRAGRLAEEVLVRSLRATFAHWAHADTYRLRTLTLRRLGLLAGDQVEEESKGEE